MSTQPNLFDPNPAPERDPSFEIRPRHDGPGLTKRDQLRLGTLQARVFELTRDGEWRTLREISDACGGSEASVSARLRDFRKDVFAEVYGPLQVDKRRRTEGTYEYRVVPA